MRFLSVALVAAVAVHAQLEHSYDQYTPRVGVKSSPVTRLAKQNNKELRDNEVPIGKVYQFGKQVEVNTTLADGRWTDAPNGRVWSITFESEDAYTMNLLFSQFRIPEGAALWIYGAGDEIQGAYTNENNYKSGEFGNWPIDGDRITVEYFQPFDVAKLPILNIAEVVHGYKEQPSALACGSSGACNVNSACDDRYGGFFADQIRAGGMLLRSGSGYCSGSLINTIGNTGRQYFLTAAHCGTSHTAIKFNWRSPSCDTNTCPAGDDIADLSVLVRFTESDFTLVEIGETIPSSWNLYLSGFNAIGTNTEHQTLTGIHHPSGDIQKMAYAYKLPQPDRWSGSGPSTHWRVSSWDNDTTTEPGSSGSPLYNNKQQIIGQLHGGTASCFNLNGYDTYGGVYYSWINGLSQYLDPTNSGLLTSDGVDLNSARAKAYVH